MQNAKADAVPTKSGMGEPIHHLNQLPCSVAFNSPLPRKIDLRKLAIGSKRHDEFDILKQIENIVMKPSDYSIQPGKGILLDMKFQTQSLLAFDKLDEFVEAGYQTAMLKMDSIRMLTKRIAEEPAALVEKRDAFKKSWPEFLFKDVQLTGLNEKQEHYVHESIQKADTPMGIELRTHQD